MIELDPIRNRMTFTFALGADEGDDDWDVKRLILLDEGHASPSTETIASISDAAVAKKRSQIAAEIEKKKQTAYLRSPEGRMATQAKRNEEREAREAKANLARDFLVDEGSLTRDEAGELGVDEAIRAARMEKLDFHREMTVEEQNQHLRENPEFAAAEMARADKEQLLNNWLSWDQMERAMNAAHAGAESVAEVEQELVRRGRDIGQSIADVPAVQQAFQDAKEMM